MAKVRNFMKTSNKVLLIIIMVFFICIILTAIFIRTKVSQEHFGNLISYISSRDKTSTKTFAINNFSELEVAGAADITIKSGEKSEVKITTDEDYLDNIAVNLIGKKLQIDMRYGNIKRFNKEIAIVIITKYPLENISLKGASDLSYTNISGNRLILMLSGAADAYLSGKIENFQIKANGANDIKAKDLIANNVEIHAFGASDITVYTKNYLKVNLFGAADVNYYGQPKKIEPNIAGAARIHSMN